MNGVVYDQVLHDCGLPDLDRGYGARGQVLARWRCPVCGAHWAFAAQFLRHNRFGWERCSAPSWRWKRAERKRLAAASTEAGS